MKILETNRLILRHQVMDDLDSLFTLYCDPDVFRYIPDVPHNYEEAREELKWHMNGHPKRPELGLWTTNSQRNQHVYWSVRLAPMDN